MAKYDNIEVQLTGEDANGFLIVGRVSTALRKNGVSDDEISAYRDEAMNGDYAHLIGVTADTVNVT